MRLWARVLIILMAVSALLALGTAVGQSPFTEEFGYLEGRIITMTSQSPGASVGVSWLATVRLNDGTMVTATVPPAEAFGVTELQPFTIGDRVELYYSPGPSGVRDIVVVDWVRRPVLGWLVALFLVVSVAVARLKGLRAFVSTGASLAIVVLFIVPRILDGANPMLISLLGAGGILILAIYFVHGLNWSTSAALIGTFAAVVVTMLLGALFMHLAHITGLGSEEAMLITLNAGQVNMRGLVLAGLLVGALGALTDTTIVQASVVRELAHVDPSLPWTSLYASGMRVGHDHIGSLVNTLVLAYAGASLPLLVLLSMGDFTLSRALNIELVAVEVVHTLVGSIGLILSVPITTALAAVMFSGDRLKLRAGELHAGHKH
ncbi:MAG: YibE/F family protein [Trueperaceae bacterium]|nr:YibE/F family protein [Trueperaceae bacterium]